MFGLKRDTIWQRHNCMASTLRKTCHVG